jgi:hypothetical protein
LHPRSTSPRRDRADAAHLQTHDGPADVLCPRPVRAPTAAPGITGTVIIGAAATSGRRVVANGRVQLRVVAALMRDTWTDDHSDEQRLVLHASAGAGALAIVTPTGAGSAQAVYVIVDALGPPLDLDRIRADDIQPDDRFRFIMLTDQARDLARP